MDHSLLDEPASVLAIEKDSRPWFTTYNPYYGPAQTQTYWFVPFPADEFPPHSPWEDHVLIAHFGIERYATAAGYDSVSVYIKDLIRDAAMR